MFFLMAGDSITPITLRAIVRMLTLSNGGERMFGSQIGASLGLDAARVSVPRDWGFMRITEMPKNVFPGLRRVRGSSLLQLRPFPRLVQ